MVVIGISKILIQSAGKMSFKFAHLINRTIKNNKSFYRQLPYWLTVFYAALILLLLDIKYSQIGLYILMSYLWVPYHIIYGSN